MLVRAGAGTPIVDHLLASRASYEDRPRSLRLHAIHPCMRPGIRARAVDSHHWQDRRVHAARRLARPPAHLRPSAPAHRDQLRSRQAQRRRRGANATRRDGRAHRHDPPRCLAAHHRRRDRREEREAEVHVGHGERHRSAGEARPRWRHGRLHAALPRASRARDVLRAAPPRDVDAGRSDRDAIVGADLQRAQRQDHVGDPRHRRHGRQRLVEWPARRHRRHRGRGEADLALDAGAPRVDVHVLDRGREVQHSARPLARHSRSSTGSRRTR